MQLFEQNAVFVEARVQVFIFHENNKYQYKFVVQAII